MTFLTLRQAAEYLGYSYEHMRRLAKDGFVPCKRLTFGKDKEKKQPKYKFVKEKLDEFMNQDLPYINPQTLKVVGARR